MTSYILSPAAQADIDGIWDYTADCSSIEQADEYVRQIKQACHSISASYRKGRALTEIRKGYRKLAVGSHFIIFRFLDEDVDVVRILHQRMDIASQLEG